MTPLMVKKSVEKSLTDDKKVGDIVFSLTNPDPDHYVEMNGQTIDANGNERLKILPFSEPVSVANQSYACMTDDANLIAVCNGNFAVSTRYYYNKSIPSTYNVYLFKNDKSKVTLYTSASYYSPLYSGSNESCLFLLFRESDSGTNNLSLRVFDSNGDLLRTIGNYSMNNLIGVRFFTDGNLAVMMMNYNNSITVISTLDNFETTTSATINGLIGSCNYSYQNTTFQPIYKYDGKYYFIVVSEMTISARPTYTCYTSLNGLQWTSLWSKTSTGLYSSLNKIYIEIEFLSDGSGR